MSKAILVMNMPECCDKCPLFLGVYTDMTCKANGRTINYPYPKDFKQDWCPLKELPKKKQIQCTDPVFVRGAKNGYNSCINEILKGSD